jgi:hypothetical protein
VNDIKSILNTLQFWQIFHVKMNGNVVAHRLAKVVVKHVINLAWMEEISSCICDDVLLGQHVVFCFGNEN